MTNDLEFKLYLYLVEDGTVKFRYRKSAALGEHPNGVLEFDAGYGVLYTDSEALTVKPRVAKVNLTKGFNELSWRYTFKLTANIDPFLEIYVI